MTAGPNELKLGNRTPLWQAARQLLLRRGGEYVACCAATREAFSLEEIHDFRVSSRRLREALVLCAPCYDPEALRKCGREVRKVTRLLGFLRNLDEAFLFFSALVQELDMSRRMALMPYLMSHEASRSSQLGYLGRLLGEYRPERFLDRYRRLLSCPSLLNSTGGIDLFMPLREFAETAMKEGHEGLLPLVSPARSEEDDVARHRLRIALKHYRYRFELFEPLADKRYAAAYRLIKQYQQHLGALNDLTVFSGMLADGLVSPQSVPGILMAVEQKKRKLVRVFLKLLDKKPLDTITFPFGD